MPPDNKTMQLDPNSQRRFAVEVVRKLRQAGHTAYWAGGCVRDQMLQRVPKDYDVATDATPEGIRQAFTNRKTLAMGAAFGVITVVGPRGAGQIEVATFRCDAQYSDGRHPDSVRFSTPEEDASRRDFTINGIFYDPLEDRVIDFVGGREDLDRQVVRAIGDPEARIGEDKLRMLRAVRFTATFGFHLDEGTLKAVRRMASEINVVSPERIATEMRRMLVDQNRVEAVRLLLQTGLADVVLPEIATDTLDETLLILARLPQPEFPLALAGLLSGRVDVEGAKAVCDRWRLSNRETDRVEWLIEHRASLAGAPARPWSTVQRILTADGAEDLLSLMEASTGAGFDDAGDVVWCRAKLSLPREQLDPPPLVTGGDLLERGVPAGPIYRVLLDRIRDAQLDGQIATRADALALADRVLDS